MVKKSEKAAKEPVKKDKIAKEKVAKKKVVKEKKPTDKLADKTALTKFLQGVFGDAQKKILKKLWKKAQVINKLESKYEAMSDEELKGQTEKFKEELEKKSLDDILPEVFAVAREASKRVLGMRPYDVQLIGGMVLNMGAVAEMKTGEGKTLVAMLPAY